MSLTSRRNGTGRVYVRRFDHEEALARLEAGESAAALAREYGVTPQAVRRLRDKQREAEYIRRWRTGVCDVCGGPAMRLVCGKKEHNPDGRCLCHACRSVDRRERLRFDNAGVLRSVRCNKLDCANGERWQPPDHFTRGTQFHDVRPGGIHGLCRACQTRARQAYREARKQPCVDCGTPALPASEKLTRGGPVPRCRACYVKSLRYRERHPDYRKRNGGSQAIGSRGRAPEAAQTTASAE